MLNFDYLNNLNDKQKEAVTYLNGPLLIVAGAGSGKTKELTSKLGDIYMLEGSMFSNELEMAGRVDCIAEFAGKVSVIDFKTSTKHKTPSKIKNYFLQETAYAKMFEENFNVPIERIVTIVAVEATGQSQLFVEEPGKWVDQLKDLRAQYRAEYNM